MIALPSGATVDVWVARSDREPTQRRGWGDTLAAAALARYGYVDARAGLTRSELGKPYLPAPGAPSLSLAHTLGCSAMAVAAPDLPLGIDLERYRSIPEASLIAERWFDVQERRALGRGDAIGRFLSLWTAREAALKAAGVGLSVEFERVELLLDDRDQPRRVVLPLSADAVWDVHPLTIGREVVAALAVPPGRAVEVRYRELGSLSAAIDTDGSVDARRATSR